MHDWLGGDPDDFLIFYGASRSKKIDYDGNLRQYLKSLGLEHLQARDRDASPEDVMRTLAKRRMRYSVKGMSVVLSLVERPATSRTVMAFDIVRTLKKRSVEQGHEAIGQATLLVTSGQLTVETSDRVVDFLEDAEKVHEFCRGLYEDFDAAPRTINPASAAWMARKVLTYLGGVALKVNDRSGTAWWMPCTGLAKARDYCEGLGWEFLALPVVMNEELARAIEAGREKGAA